MAKKENSARTWDESVAWLRDHGFDLLDAPGTQNRIFLKKYNCSAAIEKTEDGGVKIFAYPGALVNGQIAKLVNKGYQQFFKTTKSELPATADRLKALHDFTEELKEAIGAPSLYNESLGTVSTNYEYDRVKGRDDGSDKNRPWDNQPRPRAPRQSRKPA
jgi:hypothetical protein